MKHASSQGCSLFSPEGAELSELPLLAVDSSAVRAHCLVPVLVFGLFSP